MSVSIVMAMAASLSIVCDHLCSTLSLSRCPRLQPPHGEFVLMNFHIGSLRHEGQIPFRVTPMLSAISEYKQELRLQIRAEFAVRARARLRRVVPRSRRAHGAFRARARRCVAPLTSRACAA